jgi:hypothetical protein
VKSFLASKYNLENHISLQEAERLTGKANSRSSKSLAEQVALHARVIEVEVLYWYQQGEYPTTDKLKQLQFDRPYKSIVMTHYDRLHLRCIESGEPTDGKDPQVTDFLRGCNQRKSDFGDRTQYSQVWILLANAARLAAVSKYI